jgi:hypothetical protein
MAMGLARMPAMAGPMARFRRDLRRRYPARSGAPAEVTAVRAGDAGFVLRLERLPPEIGVLLIVVGAAGILLPGPVGSPFLVAGGVALWPSAFRRAEGWLERVSPRLFAEGLRQMERFLADLERRYPGSTQSRA